MSNNNAGNSRDDWLIPAFERSYKRASKGLIVSAVVLVILASCYLATLNILYEWIAAIPACIAFFCLGHQRALIKADDYIQDFASQVSLIIEARLSEGRTIKSGSVKSS